MKIVWVLVVEGQLPELFPVPAWPNTHKLIDGEERSMVAYLPVYILKECEESFTYVITCLSADFVEV